MNISNSFPYLSEGNYFTHPLGQFPSLLEVLESDKIPALKKYLLQEVKLSHTDKIAVVNYVRTHSLIYLSDNIEDMELLLWIAVIKKESVGAKSLLEGEAHVYAANKDNTTDLFLTAIYNDDADMVRILAQKFDVNRPTCMGVFPLLAAILTSGEMNFSIIEALIEHGADPNIADSEGDSVLSCAIISKMPSKNRLKVAEFLLKNKADPNMANKKRLTPLLCAIYALNELDHDKELRLSMIKLLVKYGASIGKQGNCSQSALYYALKWERSDPEVIKYLLDCGSDPNEVCEQNRKLLSIAIQNEKDDCLEIVPLLLQYGARINSDNSMFVSPLALACTANKEQMVRLLLKNKADPNHKELGMPILLLAVLEKNTAIIRALLEHGADIESKDNFNHTVLSLAINDEIENKEVIKLLLERGADPNTRLELHSPCLYFAAARNFIEVTEMLLQYGANPNPKSLIASVELLNLSFREKFWEMAKLLLRYGVLPDVNQLDRFMEIAKKNQDQELFNLLGHHKKIIFDAKKIEDAAFYAPICYDQDKATFNWERVELLLQRNVTPSQGLSKLFFKACIVESNCKTARFLLQSSTKNYIQPAMYLSLAITAGKIEIVALLLEYIQKANSIKKQILEGIHKEIDIVLDHCLYLVKELKQLASDYGKTKPIGKVEHCLTARVIYFQCMDYLERVALFIAKDFGNQKQLKEVTKVVIELNSCMNNTHNGLEDISLQEAIAKWPLPKQTKIAIEQALSNGNNKNGNNQADVQKLAGSFGSMTLNK